MTLREILRPCVSGSILETYRLLEDGAASSMGMARLKEKYNNRFFRRPPLLRLPTRDPWIREVLGAYQRYWISVLTESMTGHAAEDLLARDLSHLLTKSTESKRHTEDLGWRSAGAQAAGLQTDDTVVAGTSTGAGVVETAASASNTVHLDDLEDELRHGFRERGYHFLGGYTYPYRGPYIWKGMKKQQFSVELPSGVEQVTVHFLTGFISSGWLHFATFGEIGTGGWANEDGLFLVAEGRFQGVDSDWFRVSYLKHEAQHLADYRTYPNLVAADLEYRAKLVELVYSNTFKPLKQFLSDGRLDPKNPHVYAGYVLKEQLMNCLPIDTTQSLRRVDIEEVKSVALELFADHSAKLRAAGAETVTGVI